MNNVMVDLETLDSGPTAAILSIGAVKFDLDKFVLGPTFYINVDPASCQLSGLTIGASTVAWWMEQSDEARKIFKAFSYSLAEAINNFDEWLSQDENGVIRFDPETIIWGNGATFDNMILRNAYKAVGRSYPVSYRNDLCYRTMRRMFMGLMPPIESRTGTAHNALDDARNQATALVEAWRKIQRALNLDPRRLGL